jgi:thiol-disulfide isomerase/thioredoxin
MLVALAFVLWVAACGTRADTTSISNPAPAANATATVAGMAPKAPVTPPVAATASKPQGPPQAGMQAYDFRLVDLHGNQVWLSDYRGKKVMLNFWASWCGPCRVEIPHMVALYDELHDEPFEIVAVNLREDPDRVQAFVAQMDMRFPILFDPTGQVGSAYFVSGIPTSVFLDEHGVIQAVHRGTLTEALLRRYVSDLLR